MAVRQCCLLGYDSVLFIIITIYLLGIFISLLCYPWIMEADDCGAVCEMNEWQGKPEYSEKTCLSAALSTTDPA
jgi:hypothetical protein